MPGQGVAFRNRRHQDKVQAGKKIQAFKQHRKLQGAFVFNRVDLAVSGDFDFSKTAKALAIGKVGIPFDGKISEGVIYRLKKTPDAPVKYPYLVVSEDIENGRADMLMVGNFRRAKDHLKKKARKGIGLEVMVAPARKMDAVGIARWFEDIRDLYSFCHSSRCQFVLSSGANSMHEMVSGPCLDAILKNCGIDPQNHWDEMNEWLESRLSRRVST